MFLIFCLLPVLSHAMPGFDSQTLDAYQELCAKEQDPVKRQNYCHALQQIDQNTITTNPFRQDIATA